MFTNFLFNFIAKVDNFLFPQNKQEKLDKLTIIQDKVDILFSKYNKLSDRCNVTKKCFLSEKEKQNLFSVIPENLITYSEDKIEFKLIDTKIVLDFKLKSFFMVVNDTIPYSQFLMQTNKNFFNKFFTLFEEIDKSVSSVINKMIEANDIEERLHSKIRPFTRRMDRLTSRLRVSLNSRIFEQNTFIAKNDDFELKVSIQQNNNNFYCELKNLNNNQIIFFDDLIDYDDLGNSFRTNKIHSRESLLSMDMKFILQVINEIELVSPLLFPNNKKGKLYSENVQIKTNRNRIVPEDLEDIELETKIDIEKLKIWIQNPDGSLTDTEKEMLEEFRLIENERFKDIKKYEYKKVKLDF